MKTKIHAIAGIVGFLCIMSFWISTAVSELFGSYETIAAVKNMILRGMFLLIPAMVIVGASGMSMGAKRTDILATSKKKRMPIIALNGLLVLLPSAFFLASKASAGQFDTWFYTVQGIELVAGAVNLSLMGLNIRDGLRMTGRISVSQDPEQTPLIKPRENGPLSATGLASLIDADGQPLECRPAMALCRCGASRNKPFCDGSHNEIGFENDSEDASSRDRIISYKGKAATIHYNRLLCSHAGECGKRLPEVFNADRNPWVEPDQGNMTELEAVVEACPSGALRISVEQDEPRHLVTDRASVKVEKNGPFRVTNIALAGEPKWPTCASTQKYVLCRCGQSGNKPFCDGTHYDIKWRDS